MRLPDGSGERGALDERGGTGRAREAGGQLRQRLDRLAACHPSSPEYGQDHGAPGESGELEYGPPGYGEMDYGAPGESGEPEDAAGAERATDEQDRRAGRDGEPGRRGQQPAGRPGSGHPAGWRAGDAGRRMDGGAAGGLPGGREPYRPWFTAGEAPEPWFAGESGG